MEKLQWLLDNWEKISVIITFAITSFITLASAIVKLLPTLRQDNPILPTVKVLSKIAMNRNKDDNTERDKITAIDEIKDLNNPKA
ncbi:MAG: hypothetical protein WC356_02690 [Candidatus Micrarchaeia archaeon]|jgi:hypothetical protein